MKLYTEEQVKDMLELTNLNVQFHIDTMIPIELPSDEEIEEESTFRYPIKKIAGYMSEEDFVIYVKNELFKEGAKWMKEQILNQNK